MKIIAILLALLSMINVEVGYAKNKPLEELRGNPQQIHWNETKNVWVNDNDLTFDTWMLGCQEECESVRKWFTDSREIPVQIEYRLRLTTFYREPEKTQSVMLIATTPARKNRRFVGINVEEKQDWPEESKIWPHLGVTYVGTIAKQEQYDVVLWDELIQGPAPLERLIQPGDIVGLSLVTTGIERGIELARRIKELGADYVIAGNDSAMFRAKQLLELPDHPVDVVFTSNSITSIREFFRDPDAIAVGVVHVDHVAICGEHVPYVSNETDGVTHERKAFTADDFFLVPDLGLFGPEYWDTVWSSYRSQFGHKHSDPGNVRNAIALLAQGCGRAGMGDICDYCTIRHVANVVLPPEGYLEETLATYKAFGINTFFNVTDSAFEMGKLAERLEKAGRVDTFIMYGRAQAIAQRPDLLEKWLGCVNERLLINCGMDSGDECILQLGINKSGSKMGSRLEENRQAVINIKNAGLKAHLHYSVIFGSPGETRESCERTLAFVQWTIDTLGEQLDVVEGDQFWVNHGAPCSEIFHSYEGAQRRAALAGKTISHEEWQEHFAQYADELVVPFSCQTAWYRFFTDITIEDAWAYNAQVKTMMEQVPGHISGREFAFKPPPIA